MGCCRVMPASRPTMRCLLTMPASETYKSDARSTVWRVDAEGGAYVVKRYEYSPLRQRLGLWLGLHPGQRERRGVRRLRRAGLAAPRVSMWGVHGGRYAQAMPWGGASLQRLIGSESWEQAEVREAVLGALAETAADLLAAGLAHRDLKVGNVLTDPEGQRGARSVTLIDVGAVRRSGGGARGRRRRSATLDILFLTLRKASRGEDAASRDAARLAALLRARGVEESLLPVAAGECVDSGHE